MQSKKEPIKKPTAIAATELKQKTEINKIVTIITTRTISRIKYKSLLPIDFMVIIFAETIGKLI